MDQIREEAKRSAADFPQPLTLVRAPKHNQWPHPLRPAVQPARDDDRGINSRQAEGNTGKYGWANSISLLTKTFCLLSLQRRRMTSHARRRRKGW